MLNSRLLFISSENYSNYFKVFVAANPYANGIRGYCSIKTETIDPYGDIKPKRFMGLKITEFCVTSDRSTQQISVGIENVTEIPEDKSLFIKRLDTNFLHEIKRNIITLYGKRIDLGYQNSSTTSSVVEQIISVSDIGKWCEFYIGITPPHKLLRLLIQSIQNRLRSLRELCAGFCVLRIQEVVC